MEVWALVALGCVGGIEPAGEDEGPQQTEDSAWRGEEEPLTPPPIAAEDRVELEVAFQGSSGLYEEGTPVPVKVRVTSGDEQDIDLEVASDLQGFLVGTTLSGSGTITYSLPTLAAGAHTLTATARPVAGSDLEERRDVLSVDVCRRGELLDFSTDPLGSGWEARGDAYWDPGGWLEVTGNAPGRSGSFFYTDHPVPAGNFEVEFRIATGGGPWCAYGDHTGADGFAVSVISASDPAELEAILDTRSSGSCLGYGGSIPITGFHIEFDTFANSTGDSCGPGSGVDPSGHHVAVTLDGVPRQHLLWADVPTLEDLAWHDVRIEVQGTLVRVLIDGALLMEGALPNFTFEGGYIGITGSTGACTNFHRFDDLTLFDRCVVP